MDLSTKEVPINDVAWINGDEGQYAKVDNGIPKLHKKNIPINEELFSKYKNFKKIFNGERNNYDGNIEVNTNIDNILNKYDLENMKSSKDAAIEVFNEFHKNNIFNNKGNKIEVSKDGIR